MCSNYPLETSCTSFVCPMVLFGHTHAKISASEGDRYPSWIPFACGYAGAYAIGVVSFLFYGGALAHASHIALSPEVIHTASNLCGSVCLGIYAGNHRSAIRTKYNIEGSHCTDFAMQCMVSPFALCQEAHEVQCRTAVTTRDHDNMCVYTAVVPHEPFSK